jgi:YHS domain-containing protein
MHSDKGEVFNKHCAMSLAMGNADVIGEKDLKINHEGEIYYFSTEEKMKTFKNNIKENISNARSNWSAALERR